MVQQYAIDELPLQIRLVRYFQQDGAPPHFDLTVRAYLDHTFPGRWIGRSGPLPWPPHSPDLTPGDFWLWGMLKERMYSRKFVMSITRLEYGLWYNLFPTKCVRLLNGAIARWLLCFKNDGEQDETVL